MKPRILVGLLLLSAVSVGTNGGAAASSGIKADIVKTRELIELRKTPAILRLEHKSGSPVMPEDLEHQHGAPVHVFMVDPTLSDFHHIYPNPMETAPGNYIYTVTPKTACGYRVWADVKPKSGARQFAVTDLSGAKRCKSKETDRTYNLEDESGHYKFKITMDGGLRVGQETTLKLTVRSESGRYIDDLQAVMGAFGELVGVHEDYRTITRFEPVGELPESDADISGPTLEFEIKPEKAGYMKVFGQFRINDQIVKTSFGMSVDPEMQAYVDDEEWLDEEPVRASASEEKERLSPSKKGAAVSHDISSILGNESFRPKSAQDDLGDLYVEPERGGKAEIYEDQDKKVLGGWARPEPDVEIVDDGDDFGDESEDGPARLKPVGQF